jgi:hypothetical protein
MKADEHCSRAERIVRSLEKCEREDFAMKIEAAMLAGTHWMNAALHRMSVTAPETDVFHTYLLTLNEYRRLSVADESLVKALTEIEDLRPAYVRGNFPGGEQAAERALALLALIRSKAEGSA